MLFAPLLKYDRLALAVSGGSDSIALMWLVHCWRQETAPPVRFEVLTVDHGLREGSAGEAAQVAAWAEAAGFDHQVLAWQGGKPASGVQDAARKARYDLMAKWCRAHDARAIVTGHTLDDQAETLIMRLARGSGVDGLAAMAPAARSPWPVLRPLLGVRRQALRDWLAGSGRVWIDDPSNDDPGFERVRVRRLLDRMAEDGIGAEAIALSAGRLHRARDALEHVTDDVWAAAAGSDDSGKLLLDRQLLAAAPLEIRLRVLQRALTRVGGQAHGQMAALERLERGLLQETGGGARTLGGCRVSLRKRHIVVARETGRTRRG